VDGDHSYQGVKADTEKALDYFLATKAKGKRFIVWHDAYEDAPSWVGVLPYLNREIVPFFDIQRVENTWLAYLDISP
ncbi:MAG: hypothetical protein HY735_36390, partial [Verrucomicrobia bacterium]|nr:hypothetical protein [Verrucomicrobiota bacterium]